MKLQHWDIAAWGAFEQIAPEHPEPLQPVLAEAMARPPRRLNRYALLALIGAQRCMRDSRLTLAPGTPLYTASEHGPLAETVTLMQDILLRAQPLKPVPFINLSGNAGGFHIAASLGLSGRNITVAREHGAFGALLELAALDDAPRLLAGCINEGVWPLAEHRLRCGLPPEAPLVEASYWLLLQRPGENGDALPRIGYARCGDAAAVAEWLAEAETWALDPQLTSDASAHLSRGLDPERQMGSAPLLLAGHPQAAQHALLQALRDGAPERLRVAARDRAGSYQCYELRLEALNQR